MSAGALVDASSAPRRSLHPFGLLIESSSDTDLTAVPPEELTRFVADSKLLVLRGFQSPSTTDLVAYCRRMGEILTWDFGEVLDLTVHEDPQNYLFTTGPVPFHWDGAFARLTPRFIVFRCLRAPDPDSGGETTFCDTARIISAAPAHLRDTWAGVRIDYQTEKIKHYGGHIVQDLVVPHAVTGVPTLRFAEALDPAEYLNPLFLDIHGVSRNDREDFLDDLSARLYDPSVSYAHAWRSGDVVIADNHALLHGRRSYSLASSRRLQRIHVI
ncbi:pyoverdine biosynthesis protein [Frankia sp. CcI156]|uniref:Pyoverdine biosynthesis protein n=1 Tax=Frankia casuarinae (strain DSM 45818 / CECT 9043 / HFP020203 / CcI3) TaxID=106370 RepID=Q2J9C7_FRACC|nr:MULTISPECIES: TauD/TfdA family dioxygenase [Frankia]ABD12115.1 pyoverdine biosynthesis protein [Frankia casuarinae]ETA00527.1 putative taurine catabolism dioxygenase [Frankia sp. CcI6]EYT91842.1 putative taurine catabolism dioxygenase [Frankia casuarinae]KDA41011.1 putative taurine catabolism dioxygenase [Frankia sp. BMG5.23]KFB03244.1 3-(4-hydroxyphenyl)acrylonitrile synthase [Frankia sp. Allo2]